MSTCFQASPRIKRDMVFQGMNCSADSYYSSQGRKDPLFDDANSDLIEGLLSKYPSLYSFEMENFHLYSLS